MDTIYTREISFLIFFFVLFGTMFMMVISQIASYFLPANWPWLRIILSGRIVLVILGLALISPIYLIALPLYFLGLGAFGLLALWRRLEWQQKQQEITVIPEYTLNSNLKYYEVGAIIDGKVSTTDLIAHYIFRRLYPPTGPVDEIESELERIIAHTGGIERYTQELAKVETREVSTPTTYSYSASYVSYSGAARELVTKELVRDGYFHYSPGKRENKLTTSATSILFLAMFAGLFITISLGPREFLSAILILGALLLAIPMYLLGAFGWYFHENYSLLIPARRTLLGHKMYLQTAEYHRITSDKELFRSLIPYFIAYNIRPELVKQGIAEFGLFNEVIRN